MRDEFHVINLFDSVCNLLSISSEHLILNEETGEIVPDTASYNVTETESHFIFDSGYAISKSTIEKAEELLKSLIN